jgi:hypothetical protein
MPGFALTYPILTCHGPLALLLSDLPILTCYVPLALLRSDLPLL